MMSQQQRQGPYDHQLAGPINDQKFLCNINSQHDDFEETKLKKRREWTNFYIEELEKGTKILRAGEKDPIRVGGRKNKNEILGLVLARLLKEKYLNSINCSSHSELLQGIQTNLNNGEFLLVLRTDGRVIAMSDEAENHFGKSMRSLYTQFINIFECLRGDDRNKLRTILNSSQISLPHQEHRLICTLHLPKGKRPSRANEDVKTISMTGHFFFCNEASNERLFIARCEALVSRTTKAANASQTMMMLNNDNQKSVINIVLNEDMSINMISSNVKDVLGYTKSELIGSWLGRHLGTDDLQKLEALPQKFVSHENQQNKPSPTSVCEILDMYTNNGDGRLTFLCHIRLRHQRRLKAIQYVIVAQLIDPSLRDEYVSYVQTESGINVKSNKAEQVNLVSSSIPEASKDTIMAHSPSLTIDLLMADIISKSFVPQQQFSPINRSFSDVVAPVHVNDEPWGSPFECCYDSYPTTNVQCWSTNTFDDVCNTFQQDLASCSFEDFFGL